VTVEEELGPDLALFPLLRWSRALEDVQCPLY